MSIPWILVAGVTSVRDARLAEALGADAVGVVLIPGDPRGVRLDVAAEIAASVTLETVAEIAPTDPEALREALLTVEPTRLQCRVPPPVGLSLPLPWYRSFPCRDRSVVAALKEFPGDRFLLDVTPDLLPEGRGWQRDRTLLREVGSLGAMVLGGVPDVERLPAVLQTARPWGVQLQACVEQAPGLLDAARLGQAIRAIRGR